MSDRPAIEFSPLLADILSANATASANASNAVIDHLTRQLSDAEADLDAIRYTIIELCSGPYMPSPHTIIQALYPSHQLREEFRREDTQ